VGRRYMMGHRGEKIEQLRGRGAGGGTCWRGRKWGGEILKHLGKRRRRYSGDGRRKVVRLRRMITISLNCPFGRRKKAGRSKKERRKFLGRGMIARKKEKNRLKGKKVSYDDDRDQA